MKVYRSWLMRAGLLGAAALWLGLSPAGQAAIPTPGAPVNFTGIWAKEAGSLRYAQKPPYTPASQAKFDGERPQDDPGARCVESSMPRMMISPYPLEIVQWPDHILVVSEFNHVVRRIWLDRAEHDDSMGPTYHGDSIGRWDGQTLVVDTTGFNGKNYLDPAGDLMSPSMHVVERWRIAAPGKMRIDFTFTDPVHYERPWTSTLFFEAKNDWKLAEFVCNDNNRNNPEQPGPGNFTGTEKPAPYESRPLNDNAAPR